MQLKIFITKANSKIVVWMMSFLGNGRVCLWIKEVIYLVSGISCFFKSILRFQDTSRRIFFPSALDRPMLTELLIFNLSSTKFCQSNSYNKIKFYVSICLKFNSEISHLLWNRNGFCISKTNECNSVIVASNWM